MTVTKLYTVPETASFFAVSRKTVYSWINKGKSTTPEERADGIYPVMQTGGVTRIPQSAIDSFIERQSV